MIKIITGVKTNVYLTIFQVVVSGLTFFFLYRYLYQELGAEKIGIWSLVIAFVSVARMGEIGLAGGVVKYVAEARSQKDHLNAAIIVQTVFLTLSSLLLILALPGYQLFDFALALIISDQDAILAVSLLPYTIASIIMMVGVGVVGGGLDGYMLMGVRNVALSCSHLLHLAFVYFLVPSHGLLGVAYAQCFQYGFLLITLWVLLKLNLRELPIIPFRWDFQVLKKMFSYGLTFQAITIVNMFFEPLIKVTMTYWGGLASLGIYQMANSLALQVRALVVESNRIMVPMTASTNVDANSLVQRKALVSKSTRIVLFSSICLFGLTLIASPIISILWLGDQNELFLLFLGIVSVGWGFNTIIGPIYFLNLGSGTLRPNLFSHCITCLSGLLLGNSLGYFFEVRGVVLAATLSIILGGLYLLTWYFYSYRPIALRDFFPPALFPVFFGLALCSSLVFGLSTKIIEPYIVPSVISLLVLSGLGCLYSLRKLIKRKFFDAV
jgi:O-antigen/teichoic acid export membrane protein